MYLTTEHLCLRPFADADAKAALVWLGDEKVMRYIEPPFDLAKARKFITDCAHLVYCLCEKETDIPVGHIIWHPYMGDVTRYELGWILASRYHGRGYAHEISRALIEYAKGQGIDRIILETVPENADSIRLIERLEAQYTGNEEGLLVYEIRL